MIVEAGLRLVCPWWIYPLAMVSGDGFECIFRLAHVDMKILPVIGNGYVMGMGMCEN